MTATKTFTYEAIDSTGAVVKGKIESESSDAAAKSLANQRLVPLEVKGVGTGLQMELKIPGMGGRTTLRDLAVFARQFASMTSSGPDARAGARDPRGADREAETEDAVTRIRSDVQGGATLSSSMAQHPEHFPPLMINMIRAGEAGGFLDDALGRIAKMYEADAEPAREDQVGDDLPGDRAASSRCCWAPA